MDKILKPALFVFFVVCFQNCSISQKGQSKISGSIESALPYVYVLNYQNWKDVGQGYLATVVDSFAVNSDGIFYIDTKRLQAEKMYFATLQKKGQKYLNYVLLDQDTSNIFPLIIDEKAPSIKITSSDPWATFKYDNPTSIQQQLMDLRDVYQELTMKSEPARSEGQDPLELLESQKATANGLLDKIKNFDHLPAYLLGLRLINVEGDYERFPEPLFEACKRWQSANDIYIKQICDLTDELPVKINDTIPNVELPFSDGSRAMLHSLLGAELTILDLWASWCAPCRRENREVLGPLWETYHHKGVQIIGYALDADNETWQKAIKKDQADRWLHASHLLGDESPLFDTLRISTIPANYLLDKEGKIMARNLHGQDLQAFINNYVK